MTEGNKIAQETIFQETGTEGETGKTGRNETAGNDKEIEKNNEAEENPNSSVELILDAKNYVPGEQIVWPKAETMLAAGGSHILLLQDDGTVLAAGKNDQGQCEVSDWESIAAVYACLNLSAGLRTDGTVVAAGEISGQDLKEAVAGWRNIVELTVGNGHILGLTSDGKVLSAGMNRDGCCETGDWENVKSICVNRYLSFGTKEDGTLLVAGKTLSGEEVPETVRQWKNIKTMLWYDGPRWFGLTEDGTVYYEGIEAEQATVCRKLENVKQIVQGSAYVFAITENGQVIPVGGGAGHEIAQWEKVQALAATNNDFVALTEDGTVLLTEPRMYGNATLGELLSLKNVVQAEWAGDGLVVLCSDGTLKTTGYGRRNEVFEPTESWNDVAVISTGWDKCAAITGDGKVRYTGSNAVSIPPDISEEEANKRRDATPKLYEDWQNVKQISCGDRLIAALLADGTVKAAGYVEKQDTTDYQTGYTLSGSCKTEDWKNIRQIVALRDSVYGLTENGQLVSTEEMQENWKEMSGIRGIWGENELSLIAVIKEDGQAEWLRIQTGDIRKNLNGWKGMQQLAVGKNHIAGLKEDGTVLALGSNFVGQCEVEEWTDVIQISVGASGTAGVTKDGRLLLAGSLPGDYSVAEEWSAVTIPQP